MLRKQIQVRDGLAYSGLPPSAPGFAFSADDYFGHRQEMSPVHAVGHHLDLQTIGVVLLCLKEVVTESMF